MEKKQKMKKYLEHENKGEIFSVDYGTPTEEDHAVVNIKLKSKGRPPPPRGCCPFTAPSH
jgi:hypothetical protein